MATRNIFLTGFMGAGKSRVGALLAKKMNWIFLDTDRLVEEKTGQTIPELFSLGEEKFRAIECEIVSDICKREKHVVSLGGGALLKQQSLLEVLTAGRLIYLAAKPETLLTRLERAKEARPLLEKYPDKEKLGAIQDLLKERESVYQSAHNTFHTDTKTLEAIVQDIFESFKKDFS